MEQNINSAKNNINVELPVRIGYQVLEIYLQKKFTGEKISTEKEEGGKTSYAEILGISLQRSLREDYDLTLNLEFRTLTSFFRNRTGRVIIDISLGFDGNDQEIYVQDYNLKGTGGGWLLNKSLEALANTFLRKKLKKKMSFGLKPQIEKQLNKLNNGLENDLKAAAGVFLSGRLREFKIAGIVAGQSHILLIVAIEGNTVVEIKEINF